MPVFQDMFYETDGKPIEYKGKTVVMMDEFPLHDGDKLIVTIEETESEWKQGIALDIKGDFLFNGQIIPNKIVLWQDTAPKHAEITVRLPRDCKMLVKNVWDTGDGVIKSWTMGAAMIVEEIENGRRYLCNDGHPDDNFKDIVFKIEKMKD